MAKIRKLYKIGDLTQMLGVTPRTIRYYDQYGLLPFVKRSEGKVRLFDDNDVDIFKTIRKLQKNKNLSLSEIREKLYGKSNHFKEEVKSVVLTDSSAGVSNEDKERLGIEVVPLKVSFKTKVFLDGETITNDSIEQHRKKYNLIPSVGFPSQKDYEKKLLSLKKKGYTHVYLILMSKSFSSGFDEAKCAASALSDQIDVDVIDSQAVSAGLGLLVAQVAETIKEERSVEEISFLIQKQIPLIYSVGTIGNLRDFVGSTVLDTVVEEQQFVFGSVLRHLPLFKIKPLTGDVQIQEFCQTTQEVIKRIKEDISTEIEERGGYVNKIVVAHHNMASEGKGMLRYFNKMFSHSHVSLIENSPALMSYFGTESITVSIS